MHKKLKKYVNTSDDIMMAEKAESKISNILAVSDR